MFKENLLISYGFGSQIERAIPFGLNMIGADFYDKVKPTGSDGITMLIAQLGVFSVFLLDPLLLPKYLRGYSIYFRFFIALSLFCLFNAQNFTFLLIFIILAAYGVVGKRIVDV